MRKYGLPLAALGLVAVVAACTGTRQVYELADTPPEFAKAVLLHHNALGTEVARLVADPAVSERAKRELREAYRATVCSSDELAAATPTADCDEGPAYRTDAAILAYEAAADAESEQEVTEAAEAFVPLVTALLDAINGR